MISISIKDDELCKYLREIAERMGDMKPAMTLIGEILLESIQTNFESGGRPSWAPLSEVTIAGRSRIKKWPGQILVRSGVRGGLLGSISYREAARSVVIGTNKKYARVQQFGARKGQFGTHTANVKAHERKGRGASRVQVAAHTRRQAIPWGDIPARPFLVVQDADWVKIKTKLGKYVMRGGQ